FAAGYTNSGVYEITTPNTSKIDVYCDHGNEDSGWTMVFKAVSGVPLQQQGPSVLWLSNSLLESSSSALSINSSSRQHYKNRIVEHWQAFNPTQVRLSLYKDKKEVVLLVFNATGSTKTNWFSRVRLLTSPWTDIHSQPVNYFSINGDIRDILRRTFFINSQYVDCSLDLGWMVLEEKIPGGCTWENHFQHFSVLYSPTNSRVLWSNEG
ncbi:uncharacterized protein LOC116303903, partial [Actinia tenebrosa]|uniref:Uncharacterized protein LOC116303903 n=1 Tax=Actinia tenebrosa TaxID=6105 RepID=A0A6P8IR75_ACTTE